MPGQIMGVLNVTPDSFSDGGRWLDHRAAIARGIQMFEEGAHIVDVGGESTRPGAHAVATDEQLARVIPVVAGLSAHGRVSIDTRDGKVAASAVAAGASLINDVSATLYPVAAETGVGWVAMHMLGDPLTMQDINQYDDVVKEVQEYLIHKAGLAVAAGVSEIWIDPGIGFGKTVEHNVALLRELPTLVGSGFPVMVGTSRKSFLGALTAEAGSPPPSDDRFEASVTSALLAMERGAAMVRVHDVRATVRACRVAAAITGSPKLTLAEAVTA